MGEGGSVWGVLRGGDSPSSSPSPLWDLGAIAGKGASEEDLDLALRQQRSHAGSTGIGRKGRGEASGAAPQSPGFREALFNDPLAMGVGAIQS